MPRRTPPPGSRANSRWEAIIGTAIRPYNMVFVTVVLSFLAWTTPAIPGLLRGFNTREKFEGQSLSLLLVWYGTIFATTFGGFCVGRGLGKSRPLAPVARQDLSYPIFVAIAGLGTLAAYVTIYRSGELVRYLSDPSGLSANVLKEALYNDYSIGILSFRYISVIAASLALTRIFKGYRFNLWDLTSLTCLLSAAFITGRILVTWTAITTLGLITGPFIFRRRSRSPKSILAWAVVAVLVLWALNYSRNSLYYNSEGAGFASAGLSEAITYLGTPMQVSVGIANQWGQSQVQSYDKDNVDHDPALTTNSAFSELYAEMGAAAFLAINLQAVSFAILAGWASKQRSIYIYMVYPLISYGFAEIWRVDLLRTGIFVCLILTSLAVPIAVIATNSPKRSGSNAVIRATPRKRGPRNSPEPTPS